MKTKQQIEDKSKAPYILIGSPCTDCHIGWEATLTSIDEKGHPRIENSSCRERCIKYKEYEGAIHN